ncbi:MAG: dihydropteroate synthase [Coriobacteriia bacterium]
MTEGAPAARPRPRRWRCGRYELELSRPLVMGILNVTPDSFSDGGTHDAPSAAIAWGRKLIAEGADIIDIGGESTAPGVAELDPRVELGRVLPVVEALAGDGVPLSIDTRHFEVAEACVAAGASIINDVSGFRDRRMVDVAVSTGAGLVVMHMQGNPKNMQNDPHYQDVVREVGEYLLVQAAMLEEAGVARERICLDPGIGFGKNLDHNLELLRRLPELALLGYPVLIGASRKRFIGALTGVEVPAERLGGSVAAALWSAEQGADVVRVHDVGATVQALKVFSAIRG